MRKHRGARWAPLLAAAVAALAVAQAPPAGALTLFHINGTVRDALGRPLAGATVNDGSQTASTAADGTYSLPESSTGTYTVTARRSDTDTSAPARINASIPLDVNGVDFTLLYRIAGSLPQPAVSTAAGPAGRTLTVTTYAPQPGSPGGPAGTSCVYVTDGRTGQTAPAAYASTSGGVSTWTYALSLAQGTPEGTYGLTYVADDCSSGAAVTSAPRASYIVDNTPPAISTGSIVPGDFGNTVFGAAQPVMARVSDGSGSGVDASRSSVVLADATAGTSATITAGLSYANGWLKTGARALADGHVYRAAITAVDAAGNATTATQQDPADGGGFLVTHLVESATTAGIPLTSCTLSAGSSPATKKATCTNVPLDLAATTVTLGGSRHGPDSGFVDQQVSLATAKITTGGVTPAGIAAYNSADPAWAPRTKSMRFDVASAFSGDTAIAVPALSARISDAALTVEVPAVWPDAELFMDPVATTASTGACSDPTWSATLVTCAPDPVASRYAIALASTVTDVAGTASAEAAAAEGTVDDTYSAGFRMTAPWRTVAALTRDSRNTSVQRFLDPTGDVSQAVAARLVRRFLAAEPLPDSVADLKAASVGTPVLAAGPDGSVGAWQVPLVDSSGATVGSAVVGARYEAGPIQRLIHGDLAAQRAARRSEVQTDYGQAVVSETPLHLDALVEGARFTLADGSVVETAIDGTPLDTADGPTRRFYASANAPGMTGDSAFNSQQLAASIMGSPTVATTQQSCFVVCPPSGTTQTTNYVQDGHAFPNYQWHDGCSPTAGMMMEAWWSQHGKPSLMNTADYTSAQTSPDGSIVHSYIDAVANQMHTIRHPGYPDDGGTYLYNIGSGLQRWETQRGVNRAINEDSNLTDSSFSELQALINANRPIEVSLIGWDFSALTPSPGYNGAQGINHSVAMFGWYLGTGGSRWMIIHDDNVADGDTVVYWSGSYFDSGQADWFNP